ncbi:unnamed protein product [Parajaminaea phylloscopi]
MGFNSSTPIEILTHVFCWLDVADLLRASRVCKGWRQLYATEIVQRSQCWRRGILPYGKDLGHLLAPSRQGQGRPSSSQSCNEDCRSDGHQFSDFRLQGRRQDDGQSYPTLLASSVLLDAVKGTTAARPLLETEPSIRGLHGTIGSYNGGSREITSDVWRHKIDAIDEVLITTHQCRPLSVSDIRTGRLLWRDFRRRGGTGGFRHLEYSEGWVVHDREGPDHFQLWRMERTLEGVVNPRWGHLIEAGRLRCPYQVRAFRFIWPHLAVACVGKVVVFDVRTREPIELIDTEADVGPPTPPLYPRICYIEFDDRYVFLLAAFPVDRGPDSTSLVGRLFVYRRDTGKLIWSPSTSDEWFHKASDADEDAPKRRFPVYELEHIDYSGERHFFGQRNTWNLCHVSAHRELQAWDAVHPDHKTGSLCLSAKDHKIIIKDYRRYLDNEGQSETTEGICLLHEDSNTTNMAVSDGVMAFVPSGRHQLSWISLPEILSMAQPARTLHSMSLALGSAIWHDVSGISFRGTSCIQLDATRLSAVATNAWCTHYDEHHKTNHVVILDFQEIVNSMLGRKPHARVSIFDRQDLSTSDRLEVEDYLEVRSAQVGEQGILVMDSAERWAHMNDLVDGMAPFNSDATHEYYIADDGDEDVISR